jgi:PKD repeat protein
LVGENSSPALIIRVDPVTGDQTIISSEVYLISPVGIAIEESGAILVADNGMGGTVPTHGGIIRVDPVTGAQTVLVSEETSNGQFTNGRGITIVQAIPLVANFSADVVYGPAPLTVDFTDESIGLIDSREWDFGDGFTSNDQDPRHIYNSLGTHTVSLTVYGDADSDTETKTDYITVVSPYAPDLSGGCKEFHSYEFGQRIVMKVQVTNTGIEDTNPLEVAFYLSESMAATGDFLGQESINGGLNSGHDKTVSFRYESPTPLSGKYIRAVIDSNQQVLELDETNNKVSIRIP